LIVSRWGAPAAIAAACTLAVTGCGSGGGGHVPQGNPDARHGAAAVDSYASVELLRALLVASSDGFYAGGSAEDATTQLRRARDAYDNLRERVISEDPVLDREVNTRFEVVARALRRGVTPDRYRDLMGPLADQLMDGVTQAVVKPKARSDRGVQAEALRRLAARMSATYVAATEQGAPLAFEESWGLWRRALALTALIKGDLGSQKGTIAGALNGLRSSAFPKGPLPPVSPKPEKVDAARDRVQQGLEKRFGFGAV
jgi:hypothetical protein